MGPYAAMKTWVRVQRSTLSIARHRTDSRRCTRAVMYLLVVFTYAVRLHVLFDGAATAPLNWLVFIGASIPSQLPAARVLPQKLLVPPSVLKASWGLGAAEQTILAKSSPPVEKLAADVEVATEDTEADDDKIPVEHLEVGQTLEGTVHGRWGQLGVFVDVGAKTNGLLRVTEMQEGFPGDKISLKKGDVVTVRVLDKNEQGKFSLTMRPGALPRPTPELGHDVARFLVPDWFDAEVDHMTTWGAFVRVWPGNGQAPILGLLHKEQFREGFADEATIGSKIKVRVVAADTLKGRIDLSMIEV